jgi:hypothetical protein
MVGHDFNQTRSSLMRSRIRTSQNGSQRRLPRFLRCVHLPATILVARPAFLVRACVILGSCEEGVSVVGCAVPSRVFALRYIPHVK